MSNKEGGQFVGVVKSIEKSTSGKNWKVTTDKGVVNFPIKNFPKQPAMSIDESYFFVWNWFDIPDSTNSMRIGQSFRVPEGDEENFDSRATEGGEKQEGGKTTTSSKPTTPSSGSDGMKFGNRLTNATNLIVAMITAGKVEATVEGVAKAYDQCFELFDRAEKTGYFEVPF